MEMIFWLLITCVGIAEESPSSQTVSSPPASSVSTSLLAPLLPLEPQFPLGLTEDNRRFLFEDPERLEEERQRNARVFKQSFFLWSGLLVLLGIGTLGRIGYVTRDYWFPKRAAPQPIISKQDILHDLEALKRRPLTDPSVIKTYYADAVVILYRALQHYLHVPTQDKTTSEMVNILETSSLSPTLQKEILSFLSQADSIKFAAQSSTESAARQVCDQLKQWIKQLDLSH